MGEGLVNIYDRNELLKQICEIAEKNILHFYKNDFS